jgi:hypothetical protein
MGLQKTGDLISRSFASTLIWGGGARLYTGFQFPRKLHVCTDRRIPKRLVKSDLNATGSILTSVVRQQSFSLWYDLASPPPPHSPPRPATHKTEQERQLAPGRAAKLRG